MAEKIKVCNLVAILPISINGIRLMKDPIVYAGTAFGMDYNYALTFLLRRRNPTLLISLIGGFFYIREQRNVDMEDLRRARMKIKESTL